ncbi:tRNA methyltransferase RSM22 [Aspergillus clavatus NRRL 1]|uniref:37S ribosomal protein Rsm22 n=1 Tax=Aspergillus clavatus (strain ATCC 1007 / CBS 513.65 / DSM 816 / NCTC 3887 / NRRL 1 / QM 1276 / 107) TaxID=344612 RepID=A1CFA5_ASPCL|nr:37S ribosomal protein Rsm22 [Aspergillus clavatus NRRL 1]EAW11554.1 37S ribosomal protein Rsm22 [Aspergillus clavatus NRRL 1]
MLSISPASKAGRSCSHGLLCRFASNLPSTASQQLRRGAAIHLAQRFTSTTTRNSQTSLSNLPHPTHIAKGRAEFWHVGRRHVSSTAAPATHPFADRKDSVYALIDKINETELDLAELMEELGLLEDYYGALNVDGSDFDHAVSQTIGHRNAQALETRVRTAKQQFGEYLPEGFLNETETQLYTRLYGEPIYKTEELELQPELELSEDDKDTDRLFREDGEGGWEEVEFEYVEVQDEPPLVYDMEVGPPQEESATMRRTREVAEQLGGELMLEQFEDEAVPDSTPRIHPLTGEGKFSTDPSTVFLPKDTVTGPISVILSEFSNKHIADVAHRTFGGNGLPHSTTTPPPRAQIPQLPIPLEASQRHMSEMEGNAYLAALYPGMYASALSVLVEVRKRLGTDWIRRLMSQEGGPNVLDAGAGGAGILAWRDVLRAEWELMVPDHPKNEPVPLGRSTVVTGSEALRMRASLMLENTTFLPRLPDYVHIREKPTLDDARAPPKRKQYDVIIAPHTLLGIEEEYIRKEHVENLWSLLNPNGGVLILLEKGHQKGFEAIAGAREMLLKRYVSSPGSTQYEALTEAPGEEQHVEKEEGMIIAPCTNHEKCPMYHVSGHAKGRRDFCHFEQRYIRPAFLQRIIGAKDRNHEDVKFSYIAVQRGVDLRKEENIIQGPEAVEAAFTGYEHLHDMAPEESEATDEVKSSDSSLAQTAQDFHTLSLPRTVYTPMKRRGHVIFDVCTPAGKIERWTVPRSYSRQAYRDARKANWGDLWALGAKTRIPRSLRLGDKHGEGKKERLAKRVATKAALEGEDVPQLDSALSADFDELAIPVRKKGERIPSWKKHADKKKIRQASKKQTAAKLAEEES